MGSHRWYFPSCFYLGVGRVLSRWQRVSLPGGTVLVDLVAGAVPMEGNHPVTHFYQVQGVVHLVDGLSYRSRRQDRKHPRP